MIYVVKGHLAIEREQYRNTVENNQEFYTMVEAKVFVLNELIEETKYPKRLKKYKARRDVLKLAHPEEFL